MEERLNGNTQACPIRVDTAGACTAAEAYAAGQLIRYARLAWGEDFVTEGSGGLQIRVGTARRLGLEDAPEGDGFVIRRDRQGVTVAGGSPRGTLYGVYAFIERYMGVRFLTPDTEYIPSKAPLPLPEKIDVCERPAFAFRENQWYEACMSGTDEQNADFAVKTANLGSMCTLDERHGGNVVYPGSHTFDTLCPASVYFDSHPEYFALVDGKRQGGPYTAQLCLTHPEVLAVVTENLRRTIRENPDQKIFAVAQNDCYGYCECPACARIDEEEGSHAGTLIRFVNAVAEAIEEEFPDVIVDTLAYEYSRTAPAKTRPRHNVVVRICTIESCLSHPLRLCQERNGNYAQTRDGKNGRFGLLNKDLADWGKICTHYNCWTYVTNFAHYMAPVPNLWVLADNMAFLAENGVTDLRLQGNRQSPSGEMGSLRAYLSAKLLWNPSRSTDRILLEFCAGYYGMAAGPILAYLRMVNQKAAAPDVHAGLYDAPWEAPYLAGDFLERAEEYYRQARRLADDETVLRRVEKAALSVEYVRITRGFAHMNRQQARAELEAFVQKAKGFGITYLSEVGGEPDPDTILAGNVDSLINRYYGK